MSPTNTLTSKKQIKRDWSDLPSDITANILQRISVFDILENAQKVCTAWRKICKEDPAFWRVIKIKSRYERHLWKQAVDRSQGQLVDLTVVQNYYYECCDRFLPYVANRSRCLRRLELAFSHLKICERLHEVLMKFPLLEELNLYSVAITSKDIETAGRCCPMLKTLKVNKSPDERWLMDADHATKVAIAIGENLHGLRHLELIGSKMRNTGLQAILDGCRHLETLDLRKCWRIDLSNGDLRKRCFIQIKSLKLPNDSLEGCPYPLQIIRLPKGKRKRKPPKPIETLDYKSP